MFLAYKKDWAKPWFFYGNNGLRATLIIESLQNDEVLKRQDREETDNIEPKALKSA